MTAPHRTTLVAITAITAVAAALLSGCTSSKPTLGTTIASSSSATSTAPASTSTAPGTPTTAQLKAELISAADIPVDTFTLSNTSPVSESGAVGISGLFANTAQDRVLSVILIHYPTPAYAKAGLTQIQALASSAITHKSGTNGAVHVGTGARLYQGTNTAGPLSILVFAEGNYNVTMEFVSKRAGDTVPATVVEAVGTKQDAKLKG